MSDGAVSMAAAAIRATGLEPQVAIVLGSGLSALADTLDERVDLPYSSLAGFPVPGVAGHAGQLSAGLLAGLPVAVMQGRAHYYESGRTDAMAVPVRALREAGCEAMLVTCAAGSLHPSMPSGSLMTIEDHIAIGMHNPLVADPRGPRFVDMNDTYDEHLRDRLHACADAAGNPLHSGVYQWFGGPSFETPAEIRAARALGADAVGMSVVPETIIARDCGLRVAAVAVITNLGAGLASHGPSHEETLASANSAIGQLAALITSICAASAGDG